MIGRLWNLLPQPGAMRAVCAAMSLSEEWPDQDVYLDQNIKWIDREAIAGWFARRPETGLSSRQVSKTIDRLIEIEVVSERERIGKSIVSVAVPLNSDWLRRHLGTSSQILHSLTADSP